MEGFNNTHERLQAQEELQSLQTPGENSDREAYLLRRKMNNEALLEQIKDLKRGDEITVCTANHPKDFSPGYNQNYLHYSNMIFDYFDKNDKEDFFLVATYPIEKGNDLGNTKLTFTANTGKTIKVLLGFDQRINGGIKKGQDKEKYTV